MKILFIVLSLLIVDEFEPLTGVKVTSKDKVQYTDFDGRVDVSIGDTVRLQFTSYKDTTLVVKDSVYVLQHIK